MRALIVIALAACTPINDIKSIAGDIGDVTCPALIWATCGRVFLCDVGSASEELCWVDDSASELSIALGGAYCEPTPRGGALGWPCIYQCPSTKGCNSYGGCFCPGR